MVAVSGLLIFAGYQLVVYGWDQLNHGNAGFFQILWPGQADKIAADDGGTASNLEVAPAGPGFQTQPQTGASGAPGTVPVRSQ